jgi:hypothetical protein
MKTEIFETLKNLKYWNFLKILISCENFDFFLIFEMFWNCWNIEIFWKFWNLIFFFLLILEFWNFMKILKEFPFWGTQWVVYRETIGLLPGKQLVVSRLG